MNEHKEALNIELEDSEKMRLAKDLVDGAEEPFFLLNLDDHLSVYYANNEFYDTFGTDIETFSTLYCNGLRYALTMQEQLTQRKTMPTAWALQERYDSVIDIITASGCLKTLNFSVILKKFDGAGEKLLGYFSHNTEEPRVSFS